MNQVSEYKRIIGISFILLALAGCLCLTGCASLGLPTNATPAEQRAALCQDAQTAYVLSTIWIEASQAANPTSGAANAYWTAYKKGAELSIKTYCMTSEHEAARAPHPGSHSLLLSDSQY